MIIKCSNGQGRTFFFFFASLFISLQNATVGTRITTINATDKDAGTNANIKFTIISGNDDEKFHLNETSGDLKTSGTMDFDTVPKSYKVSRELPINRVVDVCLGCRIYNSVVLASSPTLTLRQLVRMFYNMVQSSSI